MKNKIFIATALSLFISSPSFADREMAAQHAQEMADALQHQADATDDASFNADMRAIQNPSTENMFQSFDQQDAAGSKRCGGCSSGNGV